MSIDFLSAFWVGVLGAGHCIGMCGGITTMLTSALPQQSSPQRLMLVSCYNFGRIFSYSVIGAIVGYTGSIAAKNVGLPLAGMRMVAAIFLILLGLYIGQWLMWLSKIEFLGKIIWQRISPLSKKFIPVNSPKKALGLGLLWGWLPCGLVYSTLTWSLASGSALSGAMIMACFGLGTLPALLSLSLGIFKLKTLATNPLFRKLTATLLILYGLYSLLIAYRLMF
ncbi:sulfite exporter TauE/SafE family protein [Colwelliaceae bacterium 6471]